MALKFPVGLRQSGLLSVSFNQSGDCLVASDFKGIKIFSIETYRRCLSLDLGSIR